MKAIVGSVSTAEVSVDLLEVIIPLAAVGALFCIVVVWYLSYRFGRWAMKKFLDKFFGERIYHDSYEVLDGKPTGKSVKCFGDVEYNKHEMLMSSPPKYKGTCTVCGTSVYTFCSEVE